MWVIWVLVAWATLGGLACYLMGVNVGEWKGRSAMFSHGLVRMEYEYNQRGGITHANLVCACGWVSDDPVDAARQFNDHITLYTSAAQYQILVQDSEGRFTDEIGRI